MTDQTPEQKTLEEFLNAFTEGPTQGWLDALLAAAVDAAKQLGLSPQDTVKRLLEVGNGTDMEVHVEVVNAASPEEALRQIQARQMLVGGSLFGTTGGKETLH